MSGTNISQSERYIAALRKEMELHKAEFGEPIETLYFGGGTPTTLTVNQLGRLYDDIAAHFDLSALKEFTIECNPENLSEEYLRELKGRLPVDRLSIGIQSFNDDELRWMRRRHSAEEAEEAVLRAKKVGFTNISIDLMFALPKQTTDSLRVSLEKALALDVQHISIYSLMFEPGAKITLQNITPADEESAAAEYALINSMLRVAGFEHYEISNYAKAGFESAHNSGYWSYKRYLGLGAAAHSFDGEKRWYNIPHTIKYCKSLEEGGYAPVVEKMTHKEMFDEFLFLSLRRKQGVNIDVLRRRFNPEWVDEMLQYAEVSIKNGNLILDDNRLVLSEKGVYISDSILSDLMIATE